MGDEETDAWTTRGVVRPARQMALAATIVSFRDQC